MEKDQQFRFVIPQPPEGGLVEFSAAEMEKLLLKRVEDEKDNPLDALWQLARFYQQSKQGDKALDCLRKVLELQPDVESKASTILGMGQTMEAVGDYPAAVRFYKEAFNLEPVQRLAPKELLPGAGNRFGWTGRCAKSQCYPACTLI